MSSSALHALLVLSDEDKTSKHNVRKSNRCKFMYTVNVSFLPKGKVPKIERNAQRLTQGHSA